MQRWRVEHPGYWWHLGTPAAGALQDDCFTQATETQEESAFLVGDALQEVLWAQPAVPIGLITHVTDSPLQEATPNAASPLLCRAGNDAE